MIEAVVRKILKDAGNESEVFGVSFIKKDGTRRTMSCHLKVIKHLKGGERSWSRQDYPHYLPVFDMNKGDYRTVNLNTVYRVAVHGHVFEIVD